MKRIRIALGIAYNGRAYHGWQSQLSGPTVQDKLEAALARFVGLPAGQRMSTLCVGRTDTGVHSLMQVVHFDTVIDRTPFSWVRGTNRYLPEDIAVQWAYPVSDAFHCRANALTRRYRYVLSQSPVRPSGDAMRTAAAMLIGRHDFTSLRASACQALSPIKHVCRIDIAKRPDAIASGSASRHDRHGVKIERCQWEFEFETDAFLHHMIRNILGCLVRIGQGDESPEWMAKVLATRSRKVAAPTFSAAGLYFLGPLYDVAWGFPLQATKRNETASSVSL